MAATLYRFQVELSDAEREVYRELEITAVLHPSELPLNLVARVLAFALNVQPGLEFAKGGVSSGRTPVLGVEGDGGGRMRLWIDTGFPTAARVEKALRLANEVRVYATRAADRLVSEIRRLRLEEKSLERLSLFEIEAALLEGAEDGLARRNQWSLVRSGGELFLQVNDRALQGSLHRHTF